MDKKFWIVYCQKNNGRFELFYTRKEADDEAKRLQDKDHGNYYTIMESVGRTKMPVPNIEIEAYEE